MGGHQNCLMARGRHLAAAVHTQSQHTSAGGLRRAAGSSSPAQPCTTGSFRHTCHPKHPRQSAGSGGGSIECQHFCANTCENSVQQAASSGNGRLWMHCSIVTAAAWTASCHMCTPGPAAYMGASAAASATCAAGQLCTGPPLRTGRGTALLDVLIHPRRGLPAVGTVWRNSQTRVA